MSPNLERLRVARSQGTNALARKRQQLTPCLTSISPATITRPSWLKHQQHPQQHGKTKSPRKHELVLERKSRSIPLKDASLKDVQLTVGQSFSQGAEEGMIVGCVMDHEQYSRQQLIGHQQVVQGAIGGGSALRENRKTL
ncbi:hypothetical protein EYF80_000709 [Liparis tanakae]|uniref:Uncharacterized protein n=1 Tax=Liparis tanakae TaxID=230148 RepID=A0A4Z2JFN3_9TELE|nr:hypothetical protein EYF80_000709 [Liparis tanakae]